MKKISKIVFLICLVIAFFVWSYRSATYTYVGENSDWEVSFNTNEYIAFGYGRTIEGSYIAKYKGENLDNVLNASEILYEVHYPPMSTGGGTELSTDGSIEGPAFKKSCNCSFSKVDEMTFVLKLDGKEEIIALNKE